MFQQKKVNQENSTDQTSDQNQNTYEYLVVNTSNVNNQLNEGLIINETTKNYKCLITT